MIIATLTIVEYVSYSLSSQQIIQLAEDKELTLTKIYSERLEMVLKNMEVDLTSLRDLPSVATYHRNHSYQLMAEADGEKKLIEDYFLKLANRIKGNNKIRFVYKDGEEKVKVINGKSTNNFSKIDPLDLLAGIKKNQGGLVNAGAVFDKDLNEYCLSMIAVLENNNEIIGIIEFNQSISGLLADIRKEKIFTTGHLAVFTADKRVIYHPQIEVNTLLSKNTNVKSLQKHQGLDDLVDIFYKNKEGNLNTKINGSDYVLGYSVLKNYSWMVVAFASKTEMLSSISKIKSIVFLLIIINLIVGAFVFYLFIKSVVVDPIKKVTDAAISLSQGKFVKVESDSNENKSLFWGNKISREIDELIKAINQTYVLINENEEMGQKLVKSARLAGMTEIAVGVLHNIGNVMNSINVTTSSVHSKILNSDEKIQMIGKTVEMMDEQKDKLNEFLTADPKGRMLPKFIYKITMSIIKDYEEVKEKLGHLLKHIEHAITLVSMHQGYAKVKEGKEFVKLSNVVNDAIQINAPGMEKDGIDLSLQIDKEIEPLFITPIFIDQHKFLQILINLLNNARQAVRQNNEGEKKIEIKVATEIANVTTDKNPDDSLSANAENLKIIVKDNGYGISNENLNRIFNHGFTTKKDGHGFGLHSSANAAKEMGGRLDVMSDGEGKGAEFVIKLPLQKKQSL
ncbi:MAG: sensor histidine kinase [Oligoflexia bacterium]|nr:sensor histidine kinase [Oligoflexia bacterium]